MIEEWLEREINDVAFCGLDRARLSVVRSSAHRFILG